MSKREEFPPHVQRAIDAAEARQGFARELNALIPPEVSRAIGAAPSAKGRIAKPRGMNKLEADYAGHLFARRSMGEVAWYLYEGVTLKLADDCRYTVDFMVMLKDGCLEGHEVKGPHRRDDAMVKLRVAARLFPFKFILVTSENGAWQFTEVKL